MCDRGEGTPKDESAAVKWWLKAGEQGNASALFNAGNMYNRGKGVEQSAKRAFECFTKAASLGHTKARDNAQYMAQQLQLGRRGGGNK